jgi:uncharacterized protein
MTSTSSDATRAVTEAFFARFGAGDLPGLVALFADESDHHVQGSAVIPWVGRRSTREEVRAFFDQIVAATTPERFEVDQILADGADSVSLGRFALRVNATGKVFESDFALRLTVADGRIIRYQMFEDSHALVEAYVA